MLNKKNKEEILPYMQKAEEALLQAKESVRKEEVILIPLTDIQTCILWLEKCKTKLLETVDG